MKYFFLTSRLHSFGYQNLRFGWLILTIWLPFLFFMLIDEVIAFIEQFPQVTVDLGVIAMKGYSPWLQDWSLTIRFRLVSYPGYNFFVGGGGSLISRQEMQSAYSKPWWQVWIKILKLNSKPVLIFSGWNVFWWKTGLWKCSAFYIHPR